MQIPLGDVFASDGFDRWLKKIEKLSSKRAVGIFSFLISWKIRDPPARIFRGFLFPLELHLWTKFISSTETLKYQLAWLKIPLPPLTCISPVFLKAVSISILQNFSHEKRGNLCLAYRRFTRFTFTASSPKLKLPDSSFLYRTVNVILTEVSFLFLPLIFAQAWRASTQLKEITFRPFPQRKLLETVATTVVGEAQRTQRNNPFCLRSE